MKRKPRYDPHREQNVLLEKISSDVKIIAEGHGILARNIDEIRTTLNEHDRRFDRLEMTVSEVKFTLTEHDRRFDRIESVLTEHNKDIKILKSGQERIEQKLDAVAINHEQRIQKLETSH